MAQTRQRILAAARSLLAESGFSGAGLDEVARRADVARKTIYYQFGSKLGLLNALVAESEERADLVDRIRRIVERADADEALTLYIQEVCRFWAGDHAVLRSLHGLAALDPDIEEVLRAHDAARRQRLVAFVDRLANERGLRPGLSRSQAVEALWMLTSFATFDHLAFRSGCPADAAAAILTDLAQSLFSGAG